MSPEVLASVSDTERKRQEAIFELLTSERHYVDSLKLVKDVFFDPMALDQVLTEEEMAKVCVGEMVQNLILTKEEIAEVWEELVKEDQVFTEAGGDTYGSQVPTEAGGDVKRSQSHGEIHMVLTLDFYLFCR